MSLRAVIVDDSDMACFNLRILLKHCGGIECIAVCGTLDGGVETINRERPDVVFLDIQMPGGLGFDVLDRLAYAPFIIFVTAYDHYAIRAFEVNAVDYIVKPILLDRLKTSLARLTPGGAGADADADADRRPLRTLQLDDSIFLKGSGRQTFVPVPKIVAVCANGDYSVVHILEQTSLEVRRRMADWVETLPPELFLQVDRSLIVNRSLILHVEKMARNRGRLALTGLPAPLPIGRVGLERLRDMIRES